MLNRLKLFLPTIVYLICYHSILAQSPADYLDDHVNTSHIEKLYISNNKAFYLPEETIYGSIFLVDGKDHMFIIGNIIVSVELIDSTEKVLHHLDVKLEGGRAAFSITLDEVVPAGNYSLRAYTQHQLRSSPEYLFQKEIKVVRDFKKNKTNSKPSQSININFYPEGGHLIAGISTTVAFKAISHNGTSVNISGELVDNQGTRISTIKSVKDGMGIFKITPLLDEKYQVKIPTEGGIQSFELPKTLKSGQSIAINSNNKERIIIEVLSSGKTVHQQGFLIAHMRGDIILSREMKIQSDRSLSIRRSSVPSGIIHFTLFDAKLKPIAERLVWNHNTSEEVAISTSLSSPNISTKKVQELVFSLNPKNSHLLANASISIYNQSVNRDLYSSLNINNYLLLQSDLRGRIENIGDYFKDNSAESRFLIDLLMLTHGWRRFDWSKILAPPDTGQLHTPTEYSELRGSVKSTNKKACSNVKVELSALGKDFFQSTETITDKKCNYFFHGIDLTDASSLHLQASTINPKNEKINSKFDITLDAISTLPFSPQNTLYSYSRNSKNSKLAAPDVIENEERLLSESLWSFDLENITIKSSYNNAQKLTEKAKKRYEDLGLYHIASSQKFDPTKPEFEQYRQQTIFQMIQHVATNCKVVRDSGRTKLILGRYSLQYEPPIFVDGIEVSWVELEAMDPESIAVIDFPKGLVAASVYGSSPVISLLTKNPSELKIKKSGILKTPVKRYHVAKQYFDEHPISLESSVTDLRTCIYWNPIVKISDKPTNIKFRTSELIGEHVVKIEGITNNGIPFLYTEAFNVSK